MLEVTPTTDPDTDELLRGVDNGSNSRYQGTPFVERVRDTWRCGHFVFGAHDDKPECVVWYVHDNLLPGDPANVDYELRLVMRGGEWTAVSCTCPSFASGAGCERRSPTALGLRKMCKHARAATEQANGTGLYRDTVAALRREVAMVRKLIATGEGDVLKALKVSVKQARRKRRVGAKAA